MTDAVISKPHPHRSGFRCELRTPSGWKHGPTRPTPEEAVAAATQKLAELDAATAPPAARPESEPPPAAEVPQVPAHPAPPTIVRAGVRILGPYPEAGGWRCKLKTAAGQKSAPMARTEKEALRLAERMAADMARLGGITIRDAIDALVEYKRRNGARPSTLEGTLRALTLFWSKMLDLPVARVTERAAQQQYDALRQVVSPRIGQPLSVDTHRSYLRHAKLWGRWIVKRGWLRGPSPLEGVQGVGKKRRGKPQLTRGELARFIHTCQDLAGQGDDGALAALIAVCMGLRASEILSRTVQDIDVEPDPETGEDVPVLRVGDNLERAFRLKTDSSGRSPQIPPIVELLLAKVAAGKAPGDPLFPGTLGGRRTRQWLWDRVKDLCARAGVPAVCPHALRGSLATSAAASGVRIDLISAVLGHSNSSITRQHYIVPGTVERAQLQRGMQTLPRPSSSLPS